MALPALASVCPVHSFHQNAPMRIVPRGKGTVPSSVNERCERSVSATRPHGRDGFITALALIEAGIVWHNQITTRSNLRILFHIANDRLPTVVHMDVLGRRKLAVVLGSCLKMGQALTAVAEVL